MIGKYTDLQNFIRDAIRDIKSNIQALFIKVQEQLDLKAGSTDQLLTALEEMKNKELEYNKFVTLMQKLLAGVPLDPDTEDTELSANAIEQSFKSMQSQIQKDLEVRESKIKKQIDALKTSLQGMATQSNLFQSKKDFKFSPEYKHTGIKVMSENTIKSTEGYSYRFALMEPSLSSNGNKPVKVSFKVKENHSNWLAVGICYKNAVAESNYNFNYSTLGHGAYLVSCNAGTIL